jgi:hypothetical protein
MFVTLHPVVGFTALLALVHGTLVQAVSNVSADCTAAYPDAAKNLKAIVNASPVDQACLSIIDYFLPTHYNSQRVRFWTSQFTPVQGVLFW